MSTRRTPTQESGFTIVEVLVATLILTIGAMTTFGLLTAATKNTQRAKASQVALNRAQQEMESLRSLPNKQLAMTATPEASTNPLEPNYRVSGGSFDLIRQPSSSPATMVVNGTPLYGPGFVAGGVVDPGPTAFTSGDVSGRIYRYVVWRDDVQCGAGCPGPQDFKQIIVAVKLNTPGNQSGERGYVEVQSDFVDPTDGPEADPLPAADGKVVTAQQFFLSDTPCSSSGSTSRQSITGDHPLHDTRGTCANGPQNAAPGAPDALLLSGPPDPAPDDASNPAFYDYSNDAYLEPELNPDKDLGLQLRPDDTEGCHWEPIGKTTPQSQVHRWVTDPMAAPFTLTGNVTLEIYARTLNEAQHTGTLCVYLFKRHEETPLVATDSILLNKTTSNPYFPYTPTANADWPSSSWGTFRPTMNFITPPYTIPAGDRLGVAVSLELKNTPVAAVQLMYDHPQYPARLEVDTNTPIEGG
jgi:type II secretory pathway pseudopilin PulG